MSNSSNTFWSLVATAAVLVPLAATGCDLDVGDLNNPGLDELEENPTRVNVGAASTGLLIGNRRNHAAGNGYVVQFGILGREAYNFDPADPRFVEELLEAELSKGSPFGGNFWQQPYRNIRLANLIQEAVARVADFSDAERSAILGFSTTIEALDLLEVWTARDTNGIVIDTDRKIEDGVAPIVDSTTAITEIARLLDEGRDQLANGGDAFPFAFSNGYAGFTTPATFLKYNRALAARVAVYARKYDAALAALAESFISDANQTLGTLDTGVYHSYSTAGGDQTNGLIAPSIYAHPSVTAQAKAGDARVARKTAKAEEDGGSGMLASTIAFTLYKSPESPLSVIRNEELLLLRAEARWFANAPDFVRAREDLNLVHKLSGGFAADISPAPPDGDNAAFTTELLYERRYSLLFEGHRLIDVRRFGRTSELAIDQPNHELNIRWPIPQAECNARNAEPACDKSSI